MSLGKIFASWLLGVSSAIVIYSQAVQKSFKHAIVDVVLLLLRLRFRLIGRPSLTWTMQGRPVPSPQLVAFGETFIFLKRPLSSKIKAGRYHVKDLRVNMHSLPLFYAPIAPNTEITKVLANSVECYWIIAEGVSANSPVLLELHGGGFCSGSAKDNLGYLSHYSRDLNIRVLAVEYRLAPENILPACVDDALNAYKWLLEQGVNSKEICVTGASAGGGLTVLLLQALERAGLPQPACAIPISPFVDFTLSGSSYDTNDRFDVMLNKSNITFMRDWSIGRRNAEGTIVNETPDMKDNDPRCSAIHASTKNLCPLFIMVGSGEVLRSDAEQLANKASIEGVDATLEVAPNLPHMYPLFAGTFPEADLAKGRIEQFVNKHIQRTSKM